MKSKSCTFNVILKGENFGSKSRINIEVVPKKREWYFLLYSKMKAPIVLTHARDQSNWSRALKQVLIFFSSDSFRDRTKIVEL